MHGSIETAAAATAKDKVAASEAVRPSPERPEPAFNIRICPSFFAPKVEGRAPGSDSRTAC
jgi:hypothetical protein